MRLKNKKTGEIGKLLVGAIFTVLVDDEVRAEYVTLAELNAEWCDASEEPTKYWFIDAYGNIVQNEITKHYGDEYTDMTDAYENQKQIGNYFETEEEAEKAVERLRAWKRLRDKGFRFDGWEDLQAKMGIDDLMLFSRDIIDTDNVIGFRMDDYRDCIKDLNICFGGKEEA